MAALTDGKVTMASSSPQGSAPAGFAPLTGNGSTAKIPDPVSQAKDMNAGKMVTAPTGVTILANPNAAPGTITAKPVEPAVLGSTNIDQKNQENVKTLTTTSQGGINVGEDGIARNADGSPASAPSGSTSFQGEDGNTYYSNGGITYKTPTSVSEDPYQQQIFDQLSQLMGQMDATGAANIANIQAQYQGLIAEQKQVNKSQEAGTYSLLQRGGSLQTASSEGIIQSQISDGIKSIANLIAKENAAMIAAQQAMQDGEFKIMDKKLSIAQSARKERMDAAERVSNQILKEREAIQEEQKEKDKEIKSLISSAAKNGAPPDVMKTLNNALANHDWSAAVSAGAQYAQDQTSTSGQYAAYVAATRAKGLTPMLPGDWIINQKYREAQATAQGKGGGNGTTPTALKDFPQDIQDAAQAIFDGHAKLNEYPSAKRIEITSALNKLYAADGGNDLAQGAYDSALALKTNSGFSGAVGTNLLLGFGKNIAGSASAGFLAELDKLKANLKLVNIKYLKGTGALSDAEGKTLEDASTSLNPELPEEQFTTELNRVISVLAKAKGVDTGASAKSAVNTYIQSNPDKADTIANLYDVPGATDEDILEYINQL